MLGASETELGRFTGPQGRSAERRLENRLDGASTVLFAEWVENV